MIENHYELNLALDGRHYARVSFSPSLSREDAKVRSCVIAEALQAGNTQGRWSFDLTFVECVGRSVTF